MTVADVLIIGGGGAGLTAAISAATSGSSVLVLEKCDEVGGSTGRSVGSFTAANTAYQYRAGVNDSTDMFIADMKTANGADEERENVELRRLLAENAGSTLEWMSSIGVQFLGPTPEPPFEKPRMHNVLPNSRSYVAALVREARARGVKILTGVRVEQLLVDVHGAVIGARAQGRDHFGRRAVVLATGDYSAARDLKSAFVGEGAARVDAVNPHSTGDGQRLGSSVGGVLLQMDRLYEGLRFVPGRFPDPIKLLPSTRALGRIIRFVAEHLPHRVLAILLRGALTSWVGPSNAVYLDGGICVNARGDRLANEESDKDLARAVAGDANRAWMIFDARVAEKFSAWPHPITTFPGVAYAYVQDFRRYRPDTFTTASTIEELARRTGIDPDGLQRSVRETWEEPGSDGIDHFGRSGFAGGVRRGPFYALGPMQAYITLADGGLAVDGALRVIDADAEPIPGLFAAGSVGQGGLQLLNHGLHIAWALTSGRIAGRHAAQQPLRGELVPAGAAGSALGLTPEELTVIR